MAGALVMLLLVASKGGSWGWTSALSLGLIAGSLILFTGSTFWELRTARPLVDLRTIGRRQMLLTNIASLIFAFSMLSMAVAPLSAWISAAYGPRWSLMAGALLVAAGYIAGFFAIEAVWQLVAVSSIVGAGIGLAYGATPALVMGAVPPSESASANGLNSLMRSVGTSLSAAVAGLVFAQMSTNLAGTPVPSREAFHMMMGIGAVAALAALVMAAFLPRYRLPNQRRLD